MQFLCFTSILVKNIKDRDTLIERSLRQLILLKIILNANKQIIFIMAMPYKKVELKI